MLCPRPAPPPYPPCGRRSHRGSNRSCSSTSLVASAACSLSFLRACAEDPRQGSTSGFL